MSRQPEGPAPPPVVQRLRVRYAKRGRLRFTSHRDFARAFERALRRAAVPMAYSAGFSPHPKISYVGAAPTGVASEAEYLEIGLAERRDPDAVRRDLDAALPPGLDVAEVVEASGPGLADRVEASLWRIELPGVAPAEAERAGTAFLALESVPVERATKDGKRLVDARAAVVALSAAPPTPEAIAPSSRSNATSPQFPDPEEAIAPSSRSSATSRQFPAGDGVAEPDEPADEGPCAILVMVVRHTTPAVRPDDVLTALRQAAALSTPVTPAVTRLAQGRLDETPPTTGEPAGPHGLHVRLADPLAPDAAADAMR